MQSRGDLQECLGVLPPWMEIPAELRAQLPRLWDGLLGHVAVMPGVIEDLSRAPGSRIQGFGFTVVLPTAWADAYAAAPSPFIAWQVYRSLLEGRLRLPDEHEIGRANAGEGLSMMVLHYAQLERDLSQPYTHNLLHAALEIFRIVHGGYRIRRFWQEGAGEDLPFLQSMGYLQQSDYAGHPIEGMHPDERPTLWGLTREQARQQLPGTDVRMIFEHHPPRFGFTPTQRRLLGRAIFDDSDELLMRELGLTAHGIKKQWRGIYDRVEDHDPGFFGDAAAEADEGRRGREKRRQILAYVRQRLEEVRPWNPA